MIKKARNKSKQFHLSAWLSQCHQIIAKAVTKMLYSIVINLDNSNSMHSTKKRAGYRRVFPSKITVQTISVSFSSIVQKLIKHINQPKFRYTSPLNYYLNNTIYFEMFIARIILHGFELSGEFMRRTKKCSKFVWMTFLSFLHKG